MTLSSWQDVNALTFLITGYIFIGCKKKLAGLGLLLYSGMWQYHWSALLALYYLWQHIFIRGLSSPTKRAWAPWMSANGKSSLILSGVFAISPIITAIQKYTLDRMGYTFANNSVLYRIGIESPQNIHNGSIIGALQFLAGNRYSACYSIYSEKIHANLSQEGIIGGLNCSLSLTSMLLLSLISIPLYLMFISNAKRLKSFLATIFLLLLAFVSIFQQALSAHLQGHSVLFVPIFSIGLAYGGVMLTHKLKNSPALAPILMCGYSSIIICSMRASLLTGPNG